MTDSKIFRWTRIQFGYQEYDDRSLAPSIHASDNEESLAVLLAEFGPAHLHSTFGSAGLVAVKTCSGGGDYADKDESKEVQRIRIGADTILRYCGETKSICCGDLVWSQPKDDGPPGERKTRGIHCGYEWDHLKKQWVWVDHARFFLRQGRELWRVRKDGPPFIVTIHAVCDGTYQDAARAQERGRQGH